MEREHRLIALVYEAKTNTEKADELIRAYLPFIKKEASAFLGRACTEQDDEYSISLMGFHEAVLHYDKRKGAFLNLASLTIRSRLIDYQRKEARHRGHISIYEEHEETGAALHERIADEKRPYDEIGGAEATKQEIEELSAAMKAFGVELTDVADNSPRQQRTMDACVSIVRYAIAHPEVLEELLRTKKLPMTTLTKGTGVEKKTMERHRKYIVAMLLIQTNGYEIIRGHLRHVLRGKGGDLA